MNSTLKAQYSKVTSAFYGIGGTSRLSNFMESFEKANKEEFDKAVAEALKQDSIRKNNEPK